MTVQEIIIALQKIKDQNSIVFVNMYFESPYGSYSGNSDIDITAIEDLGEGKVWINTE